MCANSSATRVGIVGAGQLGQMLALAGYPLGIDCVLLDPSPTACAGRVARVIEGALDSPEALQMLAREVEVLTFDIENVPASALEAVRGRVPVRPSPEAIATAQDRLAEKELFRALGIPTAPFVPVAAREELAGAAAELGWPAVLKARRLGYDGRGQHIARSLEDLEQGWLSLGEVPAIVEAWVDFDRELSLLGVANGVGSPVFYPLADNLHQDGILRFTLAPFDAPELRAQAEAWLESIIRHFDYRGVLTVEFFLSGDGLIANEMAPRVHNSGHWTIEGAVTSQFENHLRAVLGWPLGDTSARGYAAMVNLLGAEPPQSELLALDGVHLHHYGKAPKPGRKLGHCTITDSDRGRLVRSLDTLRALAAPECDSDLVTGRYLY